MASCEKPQVCGYAENTNGILTANGHSYSDKDKKTDNCNFAILSSIKFTEPFNNPLLYAQNIAKASNLIGDGNIICQRFGDLIRGRRTTESRMQSNLVKPTLKATYGDLSLVLPKRILDNIIETIYALDKVSNGTANDDTLLYGVEVKFYNMEVELDENLENKKYKDLFIIRDGSGVTHSLSHASASGVYVADEILDRI